MHSVAGLIKLKTEKLIKASNNSIFAFPLLNRHFFQLPTVRTQMPRQDITSASAKGAGLSLLPSLLRQSSQ